jgi:sugar phosphate isomerase/epimerase
MDTASLAGPLEARLAAVKAAGFGQVMLHARDLAGHPQGLDAAVAAVRASGLRVSGLQTLRDFEGLSGKLHDYKVDIAKAMLQMCAALGCRVLLASSSTSPHAGTDKALLARDLKKLAMLALPLNIKVAYGALSWGRAVSEFTQAWEIVADADCPNLGLALDAFHVFAARTPIEDLDMVDPWKIFNVQLSDFMWQDVDSFEERMTTAHTFRVFPGEGVHGEQIAALVMQLDRLGYRGDYSFAVFNDDYQSLPLPVVAERARRSAVWLADGVLQRLTPLPGSLPLRN